MTQDERALLLAVATVVVGVGRSVAQDWRAVGELDQLERLIEAIKTASPPGVTQPKQL